MKAMILAAGRGERLRPLTDRIPKPLIEVGGRSLIEYHLDALRRAGIEDIVINLAWLGDRIRDRLGYGDAYGVRIEYSPEPPGALDTGGGIFNALSLLGDEPFWVINGDVYTDYEFERRALAADDLAHLVLVPGPAEDFAVEDERVRNAGAVMCTFAGIGLYRPALFSGCNVGVFSSIPLLRRAADANQVSGELHEGMWHDSGTPERLQRLKDELSA